MNNLPNILVCGGAGYIGSHTVLELLKTKNFNVIIYDNFSAGYKKAIIEVEKLYEEFKEKLKNQENENKIEFGNLKVYEGDIMDQKKLEIIFSENKIALVMHFCALIIVPESVSNPLKYYENNVVGTIKLLEVLEKYKVKRFIFSSSAAIYGLAKKIPIEPDDPKEPINAYGQTKLTVEEILKYCDIAWKLKFISLRYFNACGADKSGKIGEAHKPESHLIPLILQVSQGKKDHIKIFGNDYNTKDGTCVRDYVHVTDLASAHIKSIYYLLNKNEDEVKSDYFNLGSGKGYTVNEVIESCRKITNHKIPSVFAERREGDPDSLIASSEKAEKILNWKREYENIDDIVQTAWNWHKNHPNGYD